MKLQKDIVAVIVSLVFILILLLQAITKNKILINKRALGDSHHWENHTHPLHLHSHGNDTFERYHHLDHPHHDHAHYHRQERTGVRACGIHSYAYTSYTPFTYLPPRCSGMVAPGKAFNVDGKLAKQIKDMSRHFFIINDQTVDKFVFVMAASSNHFEESMDAVASAQLFFPGKKIFYYDLGLKHEEKRKLTKWLSVEYRKFDFSKYPQYFKENLRCTAWKPIIIQEVMAEYGAVFWMDASVRILTSDFHSVYQAVRETGGVLLFKKTKHSNFAATHERVFGYFPTNTTRQKQTPMLIATAMLLYNTKELFYNVLWWFFLCALEEHCQIPMMKTMCDFDMENKWGHFANCNKWDQSSINIILSNYFGYRFRQYLAPEEVIVAERWPTNRYQLQYEN